MSSVIIAGDTSGQITLQAPAVSGSTTLTLPATSGIVVATPTGTVASGQIQTQLFTSPGTWTNPGSVTQAKVTVVGGGAGGGGGPNVSPTYVGSGGSGGFGYALITIPTSPVAITVGSGGAGGATPNGVGVAGGTSSFGSFISCTGGSSGTAPAVSGTPGTATIPAGNIIRTGAAPISTITGQTGNPGPVGGSSAIPWTYSQPLTAGTQGVAQSTGAAGGGGVGGVVIVEFVG